MKKIILSFFTVIWAVSLLGQTNFRHITYDEALIAAKAENKMVFIDFFTEWCGPCKMMAKQVFPDKAVGDYMNARFVSLKLDAEKEGKSLAEQYGVNAYPTCVIVGADGKVLMNKAGATLDPKSFIAELDLTVNPEKSLARLRERYEQGERTAELVETYAALKIMQMRETRDMSKIEEAYKIVRDYFSGLDKKERLKAENLFVYMNYIQSPVDEIARFMVNNQKNFDPLIKEQISTRVTRMYEDYLNAYFSGMVPFDKEGYACIKEEMVEAGMNKEGQYDSVFRFVDCYARGDLDAWLDLCEREYKNLPEDKKSELIAGMANLINTEDQDILKRASLFVRTQMVDMEVNELFGVVRGLMSLDSKLKK